MEANRHHYYSLVALDEVLDDPKNTGRRYNVSNKLKKDRDKMALIIDIVKRIDGLLSGRIKQTDIFIASDDKNREEILNSFKEPFEGKIVTYQEFIDANK